MTNIVNFALSELMKIVFTYSFSAISAVGFGIICRLIGYKMMIFRW
jgi:hypothetical protein